MRKNYDVYFKDMVDAMQNIEEYTEGFNFKGLKDNKLIRDAVIRNLEVIGEAAKNIPEEIRDKHPEIKWREIAGLRDRLIHKYFEVDLEIVWDIIRNKLPELKTKITAIFQAGGK